MWSLSAVMTNGSDSSFWLNLRDVPPRGTRQAHRRNRASSGKLCRFILAKSFLIHICWEKEKGSMYVSVYVDMGCSSTAEVLCLTDVMIRSDSSSCPADFYTTTTQTAE